jgi:hypothetical protein
VVRSVGDLALKPGAFTDWYEQWIASQRTDRAIENALATSVRDAWFTGDSNDRFLALHFLFDRDLQSNTDLVIEGLRDSDPEIAKEASIIITFMIRRAVPLDPGAADAIGEFNRRFPNLRIPER